MTADLSYRDLVAIINDLEKERDVCLTEIERLREELPKMNTRLKENFETKAKQQARVLTALQSGATTTREIAEKTGLSIGSVSSHVTRLIRWRIVRITGMVAASEKGGRPMRLLEIVK